MKKTKIICILFGLLGYMSVVNAQSSLTIEASQLLTSFKFTDSNGNDLSSEYSGIFTGSYGVGYRYISMGGIMINAGFNMRKGGATMDYDAMNYKWDLQYVDGRAGIGYMLPFDFISPYLHVSGYYAYMLRGFQTINNEHFNIKKFESLKEMDYGILITPGVQINILDEISTYIELNYLMGIENIEKQEGQKANNIGYGLTLGLSFALL